MQKKTLYLIGLLAVLVLLIYLPDMIPEDRGYPVTLGTVDTAAVTRIEIIASDEQLLLEREGGELVLRQPLALPLESYQAQRLLTTLSDLRVAALTTENESRFVEFALTDTLGIRVKVTAGEELVADFLVGKESSDNQQSYTRLIGSNQILQMSRNLTSMFKLKASALIRRELYRVNPEEILQLSTADLRDANGTYTLDISQGNLLTDSRGNNFPADSATVVNYLRQISSLRTVSVVLPEEEREAQIAHRLYEVAINTGAEQLALKFYLDPDNEEQCIMLWPKYPYRFRLAMRELDKFRKIIEDFVPTE
jgi:hypothetical protein